MEEQEAVWRDLCHKAWSEQDPIRFLEVTMQIVRFLALKQNRLDAEYDEAERARQTSRAPSKTPQIKV
jgi:hypothetical protein